MISAGQWARGHCFETGIEKTVIGEIIEIYQDHPKAIKIKNKDDEYWLINITQIKTADNLEDLLMVDDIVYLAYEDIKLKPYQKIIDSEYCLETFVKYIKDNDFKITAIELAENRKPQKIGE